MIYKITFTVEVVLGPGPREGERCGKWSEQLHDVGDVIWGHAIRVCERCGAVTLT